MHAARRRFAQTITQRCAFATVAVFVFQGDVLAGATRMTSAAGNTAANQDAQFPAFSSEGRHLAFVSRAFNLGFSTGGAAQVFVRDLATGGLEIASKTEGGSPGDGHCHGATLSADGRYVAFATSAATLKPGGNGGGYDVVIHDRVVGNNVLCSRGIGGAPANGNSFGGAISADGRFVAFESEASNLVPGDDNAMADVFRFDRVTNSVIRVNVLPNGHSAAGFDANPQYGARVSGDGRYVSFSSRLPLGPEQPAQAANTVWRKDLLTGALECVSISVGGGSAAAGESLMMAMTPDARFVVFASTAPDLVTSPVDSGPWYDVFIRDLDAGVTEAASLTDSGTFGNANCYFGAVSNDGRFVTFASGDPSLTLPADSNGGYDVFVRDRVQGTTERIALKPDDQPSAGSSAFPALSGDGKTVAFASAANDLDPSVSVQPSGVSQIFVRYRDGFRALGSGIVGSHGIPRLDASGSVHLSGTGFLDLDDAAPNQLVVLLIAPAVSATPFLGGTLSVNPPSVVLGAMTDSFGALTMHYKLPPTPFALDLLVVQVVVRDPGVASGAALSNVLCAAFP
jgi:Tol biopolymer transport system component